jgi:hypothetical protein
MTLNAKFALKRAAQSFMHKGFIGLAFFCNFFPIKILMSLFGVGLISKINKKIRKKKLQIGVVVF